MSDDFLLGAVVWQLLKVVQEAGNDIEHPSTFSVSSWRLPATEMLNSCFQGDSFGHYRLVHERTFFMFETSLFHERGVSLAVFVNKLSTLPETPWLLQVCLHDFELSLHGQTELLEVVAFGDTN